MINPSVVRKELPSPTDSRLALRLLPHLDSSELADLVADLSTGTASEMDETCFELVSSDESDELLLAAGLPLAFPAGDDLPEGEDEDADPFRAAVVSIEVARLRRFLSEMEPLHSKVVRLRWGLFGERPHSMQAVANRVGLSRTTVRRLHDRAIADLCCRFGPTSPLL